MIFQFCMNSVNCFSNVKLLTMVTVESFSELLVLVTHPFVLIEVDLLEDRRDSI